jgi:hypothetical protein
MKMKILKSIEQPVATSSLEEKTKSLIVRDLLRLNWKIALGPGKILITPPATYDKDIIKDSMVVRRQEILEKNRRWIKEKTAFARENLANGEDVLRSEIKPCIEVCDTQKSLDLFRFYRYSWSSPYSDYVGRRIRFLIRDEGIPHRPVIGLAALGSPIIHIPDRDDWIGWDRKTRTKNLVYAMDAYVVGSLPPYNALLGGKLISYMLASNEVRRIYKKKYCRAITLLENRKASDLVCLFTTGLYGKSTQYNRLKYENQELYKYIGTTRGYGSLHLSEETFKAMQDLLKSKGILIANRFENGPSWRMRVIKAAGNLLGFDGDSLLRHSFQRAIYAIPLASNWKDALIGKYKKPDYFNYPLQELVSHWKERWLSMRLKNQNVVDEVSKFKVEQFILL